MTSTIATYTAYWREIVVKDFDDFASHEDDLRLAFHLAVTLFHMADWVFVGEERYVREHFHLPPKGNEKDFAAALCQHLSAFAVISGIANSAKHLELRPGKVQSLQSHDKDAPGSAAKTFAKSFDPWGGSWGNSWGKS